MAAAEAWAVHPCGTALLLAVQVGVFVVDYLTLWLSTGNHIGLLGVVQSGKWARFRAFCCQLPQAESAKMLHIGIRL
jgi:hypothetical protein